MPETPEEEENVTPIRATPAEVASKVLAEEVPLRDVAGSLPRIAAELARSNALMAESIRLTQMQLQMTSSVVDLLRGQMTNGPAVQMKMLSQFSEMFAPILAMMTERPVKPPKLAAAPTPRPPETHEGGGVRVAADPEEATPVEVE